MTTGANCVIYSYTNRALSSCLTPERIFLNSIRNIVLVGMQLDRASLLSFSDKRKSWLRAYCVYVLAVIKITRATSASFARASLPPTGGGGESLTWCTAAGTFPVRPCVSSSCEVEHLKTPHLKPSRRLGSFCLDTLQIEVIPGPSRWRETLKVLRYTN